MTETGFDQGIHTAVVVIGTETEPAEQDAAACFGTEKKRQASGKVLAVIGIQVFAAVLSEPLRIGDLPSVKLAVGSQFDTAGTETAERNTAFYRRACNIIRH